MNELIQAIQDIGKNNILDYLQVFATIAGVIISVLALIYAIKVPKKIAEEQNKISLFEKRLAAYAALQKYEAFSIQLACTNEKDKYIKTFVYCFYESKSTKLSVYEAFLQVYSISKPLLMIPFLFNGIPDDEISALVESLLDFLTSLEKDSNIEKCKDNYISNVTKFREKYFESICKKIKL